MLSLPMLATKWILRVAKRLHGRHRAAPGEKVIATTRLSLDLVACAMVKPLDVKVTPVDAHGVQAYLFTPRKKDEGRFILYLHGGGYVSGGYALHKELVARIARNSRATVLFLEYRLAPEHPFPAALDDALAGYRWLRETYGQAAQLAFAGNSAGGGLCLATMAALKAQGLPLPAAAALLSPWADLTCSGDSYRTCEALDPMISGHMLPKIAAGYAGSADPAFPAISPLFGDLSGLPPLLIQVGEEEVLLDDSTRLAERARSAGVAVDLQVGPKLFHVYQAAYSAPEAWKATREIAAFFTAQWRPPTELTATVPAAPSTEAVQAP